MNQCVKIAFMKSLPMLILASVFCCPGCSTEAPKGNSNSAPANSNANRAGSLEGSGQSEKKETADASYLAIKDYIGKSYPRAVIKGVCYSEVSLGVDLVAVDLEQAGRSTIVTLLLRLFRAEDGQYYYKAEPLKPDLIPTLLGVVLREKNLKLASLENDLEEARSELEEARSQSERGDADAESYDERYER